MSDNGDQDKLLRLLVAKFVKSDKTAHGTAQKLTQLTFWREMRQVLAANEASTGLEALDDIAEAILDETGEAEDAFSGPILLLPKPSRMRESKGAPNHQRFTSYLPESPKSTPSGPKNPPKTPPKANPKSPSKSGTADDEEEEEKVDGSGSEEDDSEEDKPPPPKKPKPSRSSSDSSGDDTTTL
ncbi:hypothetical protein PR002_g9818 [Phytophthora rubi]|uniref:Uncharacterized protein n=1 Tax=Phytophthora rubi TaxID=129364 RepID=A0A6A3MN86_9STRA|nr:hypothetical protein PR002_g9818 [Phytophthora rubi]